MKNEATAKPSKFLWAPQWGYALDINDPLGAPLGSRCRLNEYEARNPGDDPLKLPPLKNSYKVEDTIEALAFVSRSRTCALGAEPLATRPSINPADPDEKEKDGNQLIPKNSTANKGMTRNINLNTKYQFSTPRYDHSGQFMRQIQWMYSCYPDGSKEFPVEKQYDVPLYRQLIKDLNVKPPVEPAL